MGFYRDNIDAMTAYVPGAQPANLAEVVKLNQNENPYPPSPKVAEVLAGFNTDALRYYPDPLAGDFRRAVAEVLDVPAEWVIPGDGSDDLIIMVARAALAGGRSIAYPTPTFPYYFTQAQIEDARIVEVPSGPNFELPIEQLAEANADLTMLSSPNSPTGAEAEPEQLHWLAGKLDGLLVIDEAYADFTPRNALGLLGKRDNVAIFRTLSKGYSLAALRLGFAIAPPAVRDGLLKTKAIYNVGAIPAAAGAAALRDQGYHNACCERIIAQRTRLAEELTRRGCRVWASGGNFLAVSVPGGDAEGACEALKTRNVLVRYFNKPPMADKLRISIGTPQEIDRLLAAWDDAQIGSNA